MIPDRIDYREFLGSKTETLFRREGWMWGDVYPQVETELITFPSGLQCLRFKSRDEIMIGSHISFGLDALSSICSGYECRHRDKNGYFDGISLRNGWIADGFWSYDFTGPTTCVEKSVFIDGIRHKMDYQISPWSPKYTGVRGGYYYPDLTISFNTSAQRDPACGLIIGIPDGSIELIYQLGDLSKIRIATNRLNSLISHTSVLDGQKGRVDNLPITPQPFGVTRLIRFDENSPAVALNYTYEQAIKQIDVRKFIGELLGIDLSDAFKVDVLQTITNLITNMNSPQPQNPCDLIVFQRK